MSASHDLAYVMENVAIEPGGKPVIGKFILALMNPGDEVLYPNPGYPIYESQIEFHGGVAVPYGYLEDDDGFVIDLEALEAAITPRTRLLIVNDLQNPLGAEASPAELARLAELAVRHDLFVLCDEAYFNIRYAGRSRSLASLPGMAERSVILYTFSKKFAMTGWRLGAALGPRPVIDVIAKLNVNDESCSNHFIQYGALEGLAGDQSGPEHIVAVLRERRDVAVALLNEMPGVRCYKPDGDLLPVPERHRGDAAHGPDRRRDVSAGGAPRHRRLCVLSRALRSPAARRARAVRAARLLGHRHPSDRRGAQPSEDLPDRRSEPCFPPSERRPPRAGRAMTAMGGLQRTSLYERHVAAGGRIVEFAGWQMPIQYGGGIVAEHLATRRHAGLFDVSHMGRFVVGGPDARPSCSAC